LDTATSILSIAVASKSGRWYFEADAGNRHSEIIMEIMDMLLKKAGLAPNDLHLAACMRGPGSFTGLRIGFAAAKGLCLALGIPMAIVSTFDCITYPHTKGYVLPVIDAKRHAYFCALYRDGKRLTEDMDATPAEIAEVIAKTSSGDPILLTGPDADRLFPELNKFTDNLYIDQEYRRGFGKALLVLAPNCIDDNIFSGPEYIRKSYAELEINK
jgi:tRNA threonylcarbamoyladenosine biosynthesis protein TsaB